MDQFCSNVWLSPPVVALLRGSGAFETLGNPDSLSDSGSAGSDVKQKLCRCFTAIYYNVRDLRQAGFFFFLLMLCS